MGEIEKIKDWRQHEYPKFRVNVRLKNASALKSTIACYRAVRWAVIASNNGVITKVTPRAAGRQAVRKKWRRAGDGLRLGGGGRKEGFGCRWRERESLSLYLRNLNSKFWSSLGLFRNAIFPLCNLDKKKFKKKLQATVRLNLPWGCSYSTGDFFDGKKLNLCS